MTDYKKVPHSYTGGVKPMNVEGRFGNERSRLSGEFTDADRAWRKQWLKDQVIAPDEPRHVPELVRSYKNIIRRFYQYPFDKLEATLEPYVGLINAAKIRYVIPKFITGYGLVLYFQYWRLYNQNDWTRVNGLFFRQTQRDCLPCHSDYPRLPDRSTPQEYNDRGFSKRKVFVDL
ncbi:uncharacterized protein LOC111268892 [Varroa jacobsoni]|uniref:NADH-ubiquinone oxidoreductase B17 subunit n=1 Tax=Varroa destructor TaxID=109461 RepID=A0A7M7KD38_VARDE|nr:uncharacterized protein LOC111251577 [Varroa destructor]XP_022703846.1 uncharacterized protein LOC111268892 [Varroa jacobsoni]